MASKVAASMPPITTDPSTCREMPPAPVAVHSGTQPRMKAKAVIRMGRKRRLRSGQRSLEQGCALVVLHLGELDDQNGILGRQADQHDQTDLGVDIVVELAEVERDKGAEDRDGYAQQHARTAASSSRIARP